MKKEIVYTIIVAFILGAIIILLWYKSKQGNQIKLPDAGSGIPQGWSSKSVATQLHALINGIDVGNVNEDNIYTIIMSLTNDQLAAVFNQYKQDFSEDLQTELNDEIGDTGYITAINQRFSELF